MMRSMGTTYLSLGPAFIGLAIHMAVGAAWGIAFAALARWFDLTGVFAVRAGVLFGLAERAAA